MHHTLTHCNTLAGRGHDSKTPQNPSIRHWHPRKNHVQRIWNAIARRRAHGRRSLWLQFVAVCYSVLQCVAVCCSVLRRRAHGRRSLWVQCCAVCCSLLRCMHRAAIQARSRNGHIRGMFVMGCVLWDVCYGMCVMGCVLWEVWCGMCATCTQNAAPLCESLCIYLSLFEYVWVSFHMYMGFFSYIFAPDVTHGCVLRGQGFTAYAPRTATFVSRVSTPHIHRIYSKLGSFAKVGPLRLHR